MQRCIPVTLALWACIQPCGGAQNWVQTSAPTNYWFSLASSADGTRLIAVAKSGGAGPIWGSTNSGSTWLPNNALSGDLNFAASSADGTTLAVLSPMQPAYISTDSGNTWTPTIPGGDPQSWSSVAISADGTKFFLSTLGASNPPSIYISTNKGDSWVSAFVPLGFWHSVACSADGTRVIAGNSAYLIGGSVYTSVDSGTNWLLANLPSNHWNCVASSADGTRLIAAVYGGQIYLSTNRGSVWTATSSPSNYWACVASSADGTRLAAAGPGVILTSENAGAIWESNNAPKLQWTSIASSADGYKLFGAAYGSHLYALQTTPRAALDISTSSTNLLLSWTVPSATFILQQNSDVATTNWSSVGIAPVLNFTNLHYEVTVSVPTNRMFYRLAAQ